MSLQTTEVDEGGFLHSDRNDWHSGTSVDIVALFWWSRSFKILSFINCTMESQWNELNWAVRWRNFFKTRPAARSRVRLEGAERRGIGDDGFVTRQS